MALPEATELALGRMVADGRLERVFMGTVDGGIWISHRETAVPPAGGESHTAIVSSPDGPWDLVDRPQEARGGSVLVPAKANNRAAGFCRIHQH